MQTFDQSLMSLVKNGLVGYEEARRQATNPDDFALRFSGISGTSDSKWDDFEHKPGEQPVPGTAGFGQQNHPAAAAAPMGRPGTPRETPVAQRPATLPPIPTPAGRPGASPPKPGTPATKGQNDGQEGESDDFQIERF
jgi:twitching motility protein PilT